MQTKYPKQSWSGWYNLAGWRGEPNGLKWCALRRDKYICQDPWKEGCHETADTVDHIVDHRGDKKLFYDINNCQSVCKSCHDRKTGEEHGFNRKAKPGPHVDKNGIIGDN